MDRPLDAQVLEVRQRRLAQHRLDTALQRAGTGRKRFRGVGHREPLRQALAGPTLETLDQRVGAREVIGDHVRRL